ncbi:homeobox protein PKNOX2-like [Anneissia japonica]|uniref:homeobox protein PKNOX2-like n=1 Tax=Anneissia japonica TaxID=1529436 RepID=UPI00142578D7|nr:homeobox protein PKNOX2-like [Anneissia japonica]
MTHTTQSPDMFATALVQQPVDGEVPAQQAAAPQQATSQASSAPAVGIIVDTQMENDKRSVKRHPLFPLMSLLFEKCEQATQSPDPPTSASFDVDIEEFVHRQEQAGRAFFSDDSEVDNLMVKAIQVLRIHLLELEKVNELCKDFCHRYITCLKGKMASDNLLRSENSPNFLNDSDRDMLSSPVSSQSQGPSSQQNIPQHQQSHQQHHQLFPSGSSGNSGGAIILQQPTQSSHQQVQQPQVQALLNHAGQVVYTPVIPQGVMTSQGIVTQALPGTVQIQPSQPQPLNQHQPIVPIIHGSTPISQIGLPPSGLQQGMNQIPISQSNQMALGLTDPYDDIMNRKKNKRGVLPKHATNVMRSWLFQHIVHPYPTEDEKRQIASQTNLTLLQVNNWFINARRRILQPMLDASNPEAAKVKKNKTQSRPSSQRFWPESLANFGQVRVGAEAQQSNTPVSDVVTSAAISSGAVEAMESMQEEEMSPIAAGGQHPSRSPSLDNMVVNGEANRQNSCVSDMSSDELGLHDDLE